MSNRRFKKYIDRPFQGRIAITVVVNAILYVFLLTAFLFGPLAYRIDNETGDTESFTVGQDFISLHENFWPAILVLLGLITIQSIWFSHRIAGPVYRFKVVIKALRNRDFSQRITLRKKDFLTDLMKEINDLIYSMREAFQELKNKNEVLHDEIQNLNQGISQNTLSSEEIKQAVARIKQSEDALKQCLEGFQLEKKED